MKESDTPGSFKDWLYERMGIPTLLPEMGMFNNYRGFATADLRMPPAEHEEKTGLALIAAHDADPEMGLFTDWQPYDHPQLGPVDIGGWDTVPWSNPPLKTHMEAATRSETAFLMEFVRCRPRLEIASLGAEALEGNLYRITLRLVNKGDMPTYVSEQGRETHPYSRPEVEISSSKELGFVTGRPKQRLDHLAPLGGSASVTWVVRGDAGAPIVVTVRGQRGIYADGEIVLGGDA